MENHRKSQRDTVAVIPPPHPPEPNAATSRTHTVRAAEAIPRRWLIIPLVLLGGLLLMEITDFDLKISGWFYDSTTHAFPLRSTFLFDTVLHHWAKYVVILATCMVVASFLLTWIIPALARWRGTLLFLALALILAPLTVSLLKLLTDRPCPWDLVEFGGLEPYTHLLEFRGPAHARGLCFPAGHAATGFALMAFFFACNRERHYALARGALLTGILAGVLLGIGRIAQGAHFMSHVLWSGLVCWLVMVSLYAVLFTLKPGGRTSLAKDT
jgi:membrane-associated PAP2 superfamily phosphatase